MAPMMAKALTYLWYLLPWEFSPTVFGAFALASALYARGLVTLRRAGTPVGFWNSAAFFLGVAVSYVVLQTYVDFLAQHMFWIHRVQHLILHHVGPVLLVLSVPGPVLRAGLPAYVRDARPSLCSTARATLCNASLTVAHGRRPAANPGV